MTSRTMSLGTSRKSSRPQENTDRLSWRVRPPTPLRSLRHARCAVRQRLEGDSEGWLGCTRRCRFSYFRGLTAAGGGQWPSAAGVTSGASTWLATFAAVAASAAAVAAARLLPLLHGHFCRGPDAVSLGRRVAPFAPTSSSPFPPSSAPCRCAPVSFPALVAVARAVVVGWLRRPGCRRRRRLAIAAARRLRRDLTTGRCCGHRLSIVHVARHQRPWAVPQWGWRPMIL